MSIAPSLCLTNYVSYMCSRYHPWFMEMGYPLLDVNEYEDGEWAIIEYQTMPVVPCITKWKVVLSGLRNLPISYTFIKRQVEAMDLTRKEVWDREEAKTKAMERDRAAVDRHREDMAARASRAVVQNPALLERVAKGGIKEMDLRRIARHIPRYMF